MGGILVFIASLWLALLLDVFLPLERFGLVPRTAGGLWGVVAMPFLHQGVDHALSNSLPLLFLLTLLAGSRARSWQIVAAIVLAGGGLLWLFGRSAVHIGASGLVGPRQPWEPRPLRGMPTMVAPLGATYDP